MWQFHWYDLVSSICDPASSSHLSFHRFLSAASIWNVVFNEREHNRYVVDVTASKREEAFTDSEFKWLNRLWWLPLKFHIDLMFNGAELYYYCKPRLRTEPVTLDNESPNLIRRPTWTKATAAGNCKLIGAIFRSDGVFLSIAQPVVREVERRIRSPYVRLS